MIVLVLYLVNTVLLIIPLWIQFGIIIKSPIGDKEIIRKVLFFIFDMCIMAAMWLGYYEVRGAAWFFFLIAIIVNVWTYFKK
jgi:hypothetical protein